jgi:hypothetical protein
MASSIPSYQPLPPPAGYATPIAPGQAAAATPILMDLAASEAPGMAPDGSIFGGQFEPGDVFEQLIEIQAGKGYTIVAVGDGIEQLDILLVVQQPGLPASIVAQSSTQGPTAVLGGRSSGGPWMNPWPFGGPLQIVLRATRGAGLAGAQAYVTK